MRKFSLNKVIWLVAKQNPLKAQSSDMHRRIIAAQNFVAGNRCILISDIEKYYNKSTSYPILKRIVNLNKKTTFFWIMGADCIKNFNTWHLSEKIHKLLKIIVIERSSLFHTHRNSKFGHKFRKNQKFRLCDFHRSKNGWIFIRARTPNLSSEYLRNNTHKSHTTN